MTEIAGLSRRQRQRDREFRLIVAASYPLFLVGAVVERLRPDRTRPRGSRRSVFTEALATAYRTIPYAF